MWFCLLYNMKYIVLICVVLLLTGCAAESAEETQEMTEVLIETFASEETGISETIATEPELFTTLIRPEDRDLVRVTDYIPGIIVDLKYSTEDNFTGKTIYDFEDVFLRYGTVMKLKAAAEELQSMGLNLKIWDGFRPVSAQFKLWEICPDDTYVADPNKGYSNHSRGFAVDVTLVDGEGREVEMPTAFDDFSAKADRDYSECTITATENARLLESVMEKHGFSGYWGEWWHFNDTTKYDVEVCFDPAVIGHKVTSKDAALRKVFWEEDSDILTIPKGERVTFLGYREEYSLVEYWGYRGYVPTEVLQ